MLGIIVITHGNLSEHLVAAATMIMGPSENVQAISFTAKDSLDTLRQSVIETVEKFQDEGCIILTDIMGGSATNVCVEMMKNEKVEVLTGVNLPMLLEATGFRDGVDIKTLSHKVQESGCKSIINLKEFFERRAAKKK